MTMYDEDGFPIYGIFKELRGPLELDLGYEPYEFYLVGVWIDDAGDYYLGTDSGCSCPTPWEYYRPEALTGPLTYEQAAEEITSLWVDAETEYVSRPEGVLEEFLEQIKGRRE